MGRRAFRSIMGRCCGPLKKGRKERTKTPHQGRGTQEEKEGKTAAGQSSPQSGFGTTRRRRRRKEKIGLLWPPGQFRPFAPQFWRERSSADMIRMIRVQQKMRVPRALRDRSRSIGGPPPPATLWSRSIGPPHAKKERSTPHPTLAWPKAVVSDGAWAWRVPRYDCCLLCPSRVRVITHYQTTDHAFWFRRPPYHDPPIIFQETKT